MKNNNPIAKTQIFSVSNENSSSFSKNSDIESKYLTFWIDGQLFGISVTNVIQIVSFQKIIQVPNFPAYAKGIINIRGNIVPVVDIRIRFHKQEISNSEKACIIITSVKENFVGFLVDSLDEVAKIEQEYISQPPKLFNQNTCTFLAGIGKSANKVIMILDLEKLLHNEEILNLVTGGKSQV